MYLYKQTKIIGLSISLALVIASCSNSQINNTLSDRSVINQQISNLSISGKVQFPEKFKTKANQNDIIAETSVALIYPSNHSTNPNKVIATGLTDLNGSFTINPSNSFTPASGEIFILEASKRLNGTGNDALSLRTNLRWNGTGFDSITSSGIYINTKTTALAIMSGFSTILGSDTIGKMNVVNGVTETSTINAVITADAINYVNTLVEDSLAENKDPINFVKFKNGYFSLSENSSSSSFSGCIGSPETCPTTLLPSPIPTITNGPIIINTSPTPIETLSPTPTSTPIPTISPTPSTEPTPSENTIPTPTVTPTATITPTPEPTTPISEFRVNSFTYHNQTEPKIAYGPNGSFVVTWQSANQDGSGYGIYAQRYNSLGIAQGTEFQVNTFTYQDQIKPAIFYNPNGDFVITWITNKQDGSGYGIYAQRYNSSGIAQGTELKLNTIGVNTDSFYSISYYSNNEFVVTWSSWTDDNYYEIYAQRYNSSGTPQGSDFRVNTYTQNNQINPNVASHVSNGDFIITWQSSGQDSSSYAIYAQRYNSSGIKQGTEFQVSTSDYNSRYNPSMAIDNNGNFVIAWGSTYQDGYGSAVYARRYNSLGVAQGNEFQVNTYITGDQFNQAIDYNPNGDFIITWQSDGQDGPYGYGIYAQRYNSLGVAQGNEFQVNTYNSYSQDSPAISIDNDSNFVIVWQSDYQDGSLKGIYAKRYNSAGIEQ